MSLKIAELFSGIGGMHSSVEASGVLAEVLFAVDINPVANEVYRWNHSKTKLLENNIQSLTDKNFIGVDMITMSPPCQPFTRISKMSYQELEYGYNRLTHTRPSFYIGLDLEARICHGRTGDLSDDDACSDEGKQVVVGICAMGKKSQSKPMKEILTRLEEFEYLKMLVFPEEIILKKPVEEWPLCDCLISFHSKGFPLEKAIQYANLRSPFIINNLEMQYDIQDRRKVYSLLQGEGIEIPRYAVLDRDSALSEESELIESEDHVEVNGIVFNKPFVEKPVSAEDHNIYIYYPTSAGGGSQRLFRKIGSRSSVYSPESRVRKTGSFIYEDFMPTDGTDVKVYTVGPDYAHAEARKSPALDGKVERDSEGKEIRYPVILSNAEKLISRRVCLAFKQTVCGFDLLRANGKSFVCDVNGFSFVKNSNKYYDDCAKILGNMILRELAPTLDIPWSVPFQLDDPPIVPTTFGKMMELRCVVAVIRHGDRTPKQKMKVEVRHPRFFEIFEKYDGYKNGHVKLKQPKQLQEILDIARSLLSEIQHSTADPEIEEKQGKLEQLKSVLEMYGHFSGINRKVQMKYQPRGRPRGSSSDDDAPKEPSLVLILKWGGELTPAGRIQAEELGRIFRCMYPGGQGRHIHNGEYSGTQGLGLLRLHSTYRHDLKIYASDEGRVQMTAAAFAKGLLALEGELTPILVQMVKSANTNGLLDNDCDSSKIQNMAKNRLHELMQQDKDFTTEDKEMINPCNAISIATALDFVKNPVKCCERVQELIQKLMAIVKTKRDDPKTKDAILYHGETWELMGRRWGKIDKDFCTKNKTFDISKIPDIYDCIKYDLQHNQHTLQFEQAEELYTYAKYLADIVIPQEYGLTMQEKLAIGQGICTPLLKKIRADLQRNIEESGEESVNRLNPRYSHGVSSPGRHVRTRLYFTSESHVHSLLTVFRFGDLLDTKKDQQWKRAMEYVSMVSELNYMAQIVIMLYEDPTKDPTSEERFHVELHFSPGVNCCVQKNLPPGPGFRPHSRNESTTASISPSNEQILEETSLSEPNSSANLISLVTKTPIDTTESVPVKQKAQIVEQNSGDESSYQIFDTYTKEKPLTDTEKSSKKDLITGSSAHVKLAEVKEDVISTSLKSSSPIPILSSGKEDVISQARSSDLAKDLIARLNRCLEDSEPRSRSFDHSRQSDCSHKEETRFPFQSLDAVNKDDTPRRHRHGVAGHHSFKQNLSYFKMYGIPAGPTGSVLFQLGDKAKNKLLGSTSSLFSTAVISGSSSAPNLRDSIGNNATVSAIEGCGGVPPIRPLETLHNALSLKQLDMFLETVTITRTPASTPPQLPSTPQFASSRHHSNTALWSGPSSLVSSSGPSSPSAVSDMPLRHLSSDTPGLPSTDQFIREVSNNGTMAHIFPTAVDLDPDLGSVGILLENRNSSEEQEYHEDHHVDLTELYPLQNITEGDSGELTPVSVSSEFDYSTQTHNTTSTSARGSSPICAISNSVQPNKTFDVTVMKDFDKLTAEISKKRLHVLDLDAEEDEAEKTITTTASVPRESIVGFFKDDKLETITTTASVSRESIVSFFKDDKLENTKRFGTENIISSTSSSLNEEEAVTPTGSKPGMKKCKSLLTFSLESDE